MKKVQRINESQLRAIVAESVKRVLNEGFDTIGSDVIDIAQWMEGRKVAQLYNEAITHCGVDDDTYVRILQQVISWAGNNSKNLDSISNKIDELVARLEVNNGTNGGYGPMRDNDYASFVSGLKFISTEIKHGNNINSIQTFMRNLHADYMYNNIERKISQKDRLAYAEIVKEITGNEFYK